MRVRPKVDILFYVGFSFKAEAFEKPPRVLVLGVTLGENSVNAALKNVLDNRQMPNQLQKLRSFVQLVICATNGNLTS